VLSQYEEDMAFHWEKQKYKGYSMYLIDIHSIIQSSTILP
jgi:hypothetical protein